MRAQPTTQRRVAPSRSRQSATSHSTAPQRPNSQEAVPAHLTDQPALLHAQPHQPQALPAGPHRAAPGKPPSRSKQRRVAPGHIYDMGFRGATHEREGHPRTRSPRHGRHPHLPIAENERGRTWSLRREECREVLCHRGTGE